MRHVFGLKTRERAVSLRKSGGSLSDISRQVGACKSTLSLWLRGVVVPPDIKEKKRSWDADKQINGLRKRTQQYREKRLQYQMIGRKLAKKGNCGFVAGCMLYWAEGAKSKNTISFSNADPSMMKYFVNYLRKYWGIKPLDVVLSGSCYTNNGLTASNIQEYWAKFLGLPPSCIRRGSWVVNRRPTSSSGKKTGRTPYGTCRIDINRTKIAQGVLGAIQQIAGFENKNWLDKK
jgi:hypothetical protein